MITKNDIIKMARHLTKQKPKISRHTMFHPEREWTIGLGTAVVLFVAVALYTASLFLEQSKNIDRTVFVERTKTNYDQKLIQDVLEQYEAREKEFEALRANRSNKVIVAPSETEDETLAEEGQDE